MFFLGGKKKKKLKIWKEKFSQTNKATTATKAVRQRVKYGQWIKTEQTQFISVQIFIT